MNVNDMWKVPIADDAQPAMRAEAERAMRRARRDMFAAAAVTGTLADANFNATPQRATPQRFAEIAVAVADALIAELDRTEKQT